MSIGMNAAPRHYCFSTLTCGWCILPEFFFPSFSLCRTMRRNRKKTGRDKCAVKKIFVAMYSTVDIYLTQRGRSLSMRRIFSAPINNAYIRIRVFLVRFPSSHQLCDTEMSFSLYMHTRLDSYCDANKLFFTK